MPWLAVGFGARSSIWRRESADQRAHGLTAGGRYPWFRPGLDVKPLWAGRPEPAVALAAQVNALTRVVGGQAKDSIIGGDDGLGNSPDPEWRRFGTGETEYRIEYGRQGAACATGEHK